MDGRLESLGRALDIVIMARTQVYGSSPAAWEFLLRVSEYLAKEQIKAFRMAFSHEEETSLDAHLTGVAA